jgi:hypothetical protein
MQTITGNAGAVVTAAILYQTGAGEYYFDAISTGGAGQCMARGRVASSNSCIIHFNIDQGATTFLTDDTAPDMTSLTTVVIGDGINGGQVSVQSPFGGPAFASATMSIPGQNQFNLTNNIATVEGQNSVIAETSGLANGTPALFILSDGSVSVSSSITSKASCIFAPQVGGQDVNIQDRGAAAGGTSIPRGMRGSTSSNSDSAAIGAETAILTLSNQVFRDGRAYKLCYGEQMTASTSTNVGTFQVRKTNAAGTIWGQNGAFGPSSAAPNIHAQGEVYVARAVGAGDLTATVVLTLTASAGTVMQKGTTQSMRKFYAYDVGSTSDWPFAFVVT